MQCLLNARLKTYLHHTDMNANELAEAMEIRAAIRRIAKNRKSVQEGANDRLADQLEKAATMLRQQQAEIEQLRSLFAPKEIPANVRIMYQIFDGKEWLNMGKINE
jgi:plasmid maintenance system antidote protein VapI